MLKALSLEEFGSAVASDEAVPGGGSVSALAGALAAALAAMVARLTLKKKTFARVEPQMKLLQDQARDLQNQFMSAVDRDADSYRRVLSALRMPRSGEAEEQARGRALQAALMQAAEVPLQVAELSVEVMDLAAQAIDQGNPDMITDAGVALVMARGAALGALMNVRINLAGLKDHNIVAEMEKKVQRIKQDVLEKEQIMLGKLPL